MTTTNLLTQAKVNQDPIVKKSIRKCKVICVLCNVGEN